MSKLNIDSKHLSNSLGSQTKYQMPVIDKQSDKRLSNQEAEKAWDERIMKNMKRMSKDEEYRLMIAKDLS